MGDTVLEIVRDHVFTAYLLSADCCCCGVVRFAGWGAVTNALLSPLTGPHTVPSDGRLEGNPSWGAMSGTTFLTLTCSQFRNGTTLNRVIRTVIDHTALKNRLLFMLLRV